MIEKNEGSSILKAKKKNDDRIYFAFDGRWQNILPTVFEQLIGLHLIQIYDLYKDREFQMYKLNKNNVEEWKAGRRK